MTHEENLKAILEVHFAGFKDELIESAVKRIMQLKYEKSHDCLDREYLFQVLDDFCGPDRGTTITLDTLADLVADMPSVQPEQKMGHWIANKRFGMHPCDEMWICSACREQSMKRSDYCPKCGADMRKEGEKMARLTTEEKANRYDALQAAIEINIKTYKSRQQDAQSRYDKGTVCDRVDMIAAYNKGIADTCEDVLTMLAAFTN